MQCLYRYNFENIKLSISLFEFKHDDCYNGSYDLKLFCLPLQVFSPLFYSFITPSVFLFSSRPTIYFFGS